MVALKDVEFSYKRGVHVLQGISAEFEGGHVYGLLGLNGAGKTTLMKIIASAFFPKAGSCRTLGSDVAKRDRRMLEDMYILGQDPQLTGRGGAAETVTQQIAPFYPRFDTGFLEEGLRQFGVPAKARINKLSHGERRIVEVCAALSANTRLLLLDEPTNGLDIPSRDVFRRVVASWCSDERCMVVSTHQVKDIESLVDRIAVLHDHRIVLCEDLFRISERVAVSLESTEPDGDSLIHKEKSPGGWVAVREKPNQSGDSIDLEILFKATIAASGRLVRAIEEDRR